MIQRKQSIWLLIAALLSAGLFCFDIYHAHVAVNGTDTIAYIRINDDYPLLLIALVLTILPLVTIFMFRNRKRQRSMAIFNVVACIGFISAALMRVTNFMNKQPAATNGTYWIGAVLPLLSMVFIIMAIRGINKDEKLVKSQDRLR